MTRILPFTVAIAVVVLSGVVHGFRTDRWSKSPEFEAACARVPKVPKTFGDWESRDLELDSHTLQRAGIASYLQRQYRNRRTGESMMVLLVCGRPGPISVHTPDVCYAGTGYEMVASQTKAKIEPAGAADADTFWKLVMVRRESVVPKQLTIYYAWNNHGTWKAPSGEPRVAFANSPFLYKMYVTREVVPRGDNSEDPTSLGFIHELLPELRKALFPTL